MFNIDIEDCEEYVAGFIFVYSDTLKPSLFCTNSPELFNKYDYRIDIEKDKPVCHVTLYGKSYKLENKDFLVNKNGKWKVSKAEEKRHQATFYLID